MDYISNHLLEKLHVLHKNNEKLEIISNVYPFEPVIFYFDTFFNKNNYEFKLIKMSLCVDMYYHTNITSISATKYQLIRNELRYEINMYLAKHDYYVEKIRFKILEEDVNYNFTVKITTLIVSKL